jgi:hypothetical protein
VLGAVLVADRSDFDQWGRRVECTGGRTGRCTKTLKMFKSG